jgi:hypothetical protein
MLEVTRDGCSNALLIAAKKISARRL